MAQLRHDDAQFKAFNTQILVMVPNGPRMIERYMRANHIPYPILWDKGASVAEQYSQIKRFFSLGTPCVFLVDKNQVIQYAHYAKSLIEEPDHQQALAVLSRIKA